MQGGDTDTNAAICGALIGAVYGIDEIPKQWLDSILNCRPTSRPKQFWPTDSLKLAKDLTKQK